jgi:3-oxoadipate enol-lactonase
MKIATNGIQMHVADTGAGRPLVFLHGLGWDHLLWQSATRRFAGAYRVIAGDTRGHGESDKPAGPYTIATFADDWHGALAALGVRDACLVGFSQGGMIAQWLAVHHPEDVGALCLVSTSCRVDPGVREKLEERIRIARVEGAAAAAQAAAGSVFSRGYAAAHPDAIERFVAWRAAMAQEPLFEATRAGVGFDVSAALARVSVPTVVVYGEEDALTPPAVVKQVAAAVPGAELVGVPGAGHMIPVEQPARFEQIVGSFLDKQYPVR